MTPGTTPPGPAGPDPVQDAAAQVLARIAAAREQGRIRPWMYNTAEISHAADIDARIREAAGRPARNPELPPPSPADITAQVNKELTRQRITALRQAAAGAAPRSTARTAARPRQTGNRGRRRS